MNLEWFFYTFTFCGGECRMPSGISNLSKDAFFKYLFFKENCNIIQKWHKKENSPSTFCGREEFLHQQTIVVYFRILLFMVHFRIVLKIVYKPPFWKWYINHELWIKFSVRIHISILSFFRSISVEQYNLLLTKRFNLKSKIDCLLEISYYFSNMCKSKRVSKCVKLFWLWLKIIIKLACLFLFSLNKIYFGSLINIRKSLSKMLYFQDRLLSPLAGGRWCFFICLLCYCHRNHWSVTKWHWCRME